jgi:23S rRNA (uracil1939-C5)-methyltransferase
LGQKSPVKKGQVIEIDIDDMSHEGQGVGKVDGFTVFVEGALKDERVLAGIDDVAKRYSRGHVEKIMRPSKDRVVPQCPYAERCGGCMLQHLSYDAQLDFKTQKVKDSLKRIGHIDAQVYDIIGMNEPYGYRNKAQFPVGDEGGRAVIGFFEKGSHKIVPSKRCLIQHEASDIVANIVKKWVEQYNISIYNEISGQGTLRHIVTKVGFKTKQLMVILVVNADHILYTDELIQMLKSAVPGLTSLILNTNTKKTNVILGQKNKVLYGTFYITDYIGNIEFRLSPLSFFQVNPVQVEVLYSKALEFAELKGHEIVIDAYCGIGTISLFLAKNAKKVYGIEVISQAIQDARLNARLNGIENVGFIEGAAEDVMCEFVKQGIKPDVIVMDPPRRGCDEKLLDAAVTMKPKRMVYVSCNPATLARDLRFLEDRGYKTQKVQPVDMFPHTYHVECVTLMSRVEK